MTIPLFLVERKDQSGYDAAWNMVIAAPDRVQARKIAAKHSGEEGEAEWLKPSCSTCRMIARTSIYSQPRLVVREFNRS